MSILDELKRRKVFRVAAAYLIASWVTIQAADILLENYGAPDWVFQALGVALLLGFPLACMLAWAFDVVPDGGVPGGETATGNERWIIPALVLLIVALLGERIWIAASVPADSPAELTAADPSEVTATVSGKEKPSIAVLPFENFSSSEEHAFFSDGLADTILHRLAQLEDLTVIARNSSFVYKGENVDVRKVGTDLNVATVLEGSVQRQGQNLRVIAQLVETTDGSHLWSRTFDRQMDDVFSIQDEIAASVAEALSVQMLGNSLDSTSISGTSSPQALELLMRAEEIHASNPAITYDEMEEVLDLTRQALRLDPEFAGAWIALGNYHLSRVFRARTIQDHADSLEEARNAMQRAMSLEPGSVDVRMLLASYLRRSGQSAEALTIALSVVEDSPNNVDALKLVALSYLANDKDAEALEVLNQARRLDPFDPYIKRQLSSAYSGLGELDKAEAMLLQGLDMHPEISFFYSDLGESRRLRGDWMGALSYILALNEVDGDGAHDHLHDACHMMIHLHLFDEFEQRGCLANENPLMKIDFLMQQSRFGDALSEWKDWTRGSSDDWRSYNTMYCVLAGDRECALEHARAGFKYQLDELGGADFADRDVTRALTYHALAEWKWGENKERAESIFEKALEYVRASPMVSYRQCTLCGRAFTEAELLAVLGRKDEALDALEASLPRETDHVHLWGLHSEIPIADSPFLEPLRGHPRFEKVMKEVEQRRKLLGEKVLAALTD